MKNITIAIILAVIGVTLLIIGYTAKLRSEAYLSDSKAARVVVAKMDAQMNASNAAAEIYRQWSNDVNSAEPVATASPQLRDILSKLDDNQSSAKMEREDVEDQIISQAILERGALQYCTGWMLLAAASIVISLPRTKVADLTSSYEQA